MYMCMCIYVFTICIYTYTFYIYSYVRVPRIVARVCRTYVISGESARSRKVNCVYWPVASGKAKRREAPPRTTSGSINGDASKRDWKCPSSFCCDAVAVAIAARIPKKGTRIGKTQRACWETHLAVWSGWVSLRFVRLALGVADADSSLSNTSLSLYDSNRTESVSVTFLNKNHRFLSKNASNRENGVLFSAT